MRSPATSVSSRRVGSLTSIDPGSTSRSAPRLRLRRRLRDLLPELSVVFDRLARTEVLQLEYLANLDLAFLEGDALGPFDRLFLRLHLNQPETGDELLRLGEGSIDHGALRSREPDACALRARVEPLRREQHAGLHQLFVILRHLGKLLFGRENARL